MKNNEELLFKPEDLLNKRTMVERIYPQSELKERNQILGSLKTEEEERIVECPICMAYGTRTHHLGNFTQNMTKELKKIEEEDVFQKITESLNKTEESSAPNSERVEERVPCHYGKIYFDEKDRQYKQTCEACGYTKVVNQENNVFSVLREQLQVQRAELESAKSSYPSIMKKYRQDYEQPKTAVPMTRTYTLTK